MSYSSHFNLDLDWVKENLHEYNEAVHSYEDSGYYLINNSLRKGKISNRIYNWVKDIIDEINKSTPYPTELVTYRGTRHPFYLNLAPGQEFIDDGFVSTTVNRNHAIGLGTAVLEINWKPDTKFIYLLGEAEMLTYPIVKFKVLEVDSYQVKRYYRDKQTGLAKQRYEQVPYIVVDSELAFNADRIVAMIDPTLDQEYDSKYPTFSYLTYDNFILEKLNIKSEE